MMLDAVKGFRSDSQPVVSGDPIRSVSLKSSFYLDDGSPSPSLLRSNAEWQLRLKDHLVIAERGDGELYLIPFHNIAGMSIPRDARAIPEPVPQSDEAPDHSATKQLADQASARARGRPGLRK